MFSEEKMQWSLTFFQSGRLDELYATYLALLTEKIVVQICASTRFVERKYILCEFLILSSSSAPKCSSTGSELQISSDSNVCLLRFFVFFFYLHWSHMVNHPLNTPFHQLLSSKATGVSQV